MAGLARLATAALVALALAPAGADARSVIPLPVPGAGAFTTDVVLTARGAAVVSRDALGRRVSIYEATPGGTHRVTAFDPLLRSPLEADQDRDFSEVLGSPFALAVSGRRWSTGDDESLVVEETWVSPAGGGAVEVIQRCERSRTGAIEIREQVMVWTPGCEKPIDDKRGDPTLVRDLVTGASAEIRPRPDETISGFQAAGDYVALGTVDDDSEDLLPITVFEWRTGRELFRVAPPEGWFLEDFDVGPDGTLVAAYVDLGVRRRGPCEDGPPRLIWYSPADPRPHEIPMKVCTPIGLKLAGGYVTAVDRRGARPRHVLQPLDGSELIAISDEARPLDFDGERVARIRAGCARDALVLDDLTAIRRDGLPESKRESCPFELAERPRIRVDRRGRFELLLRCPAGCRHGRVSVRDGDVLLSEGGFEARPGTTAHVHMRLGRTRRLRLRRSGEIESFVEAYLPQPSGRERRRTARVRLIAP